MDPLTRFLGEHPPFSDVPAAQLDRIARVAAVEDYPAGTEVTNAVDRPGGDLYVVWSGRVELRHTDAHSAVSPVDLLDPGCVFRPSARLDEGVPGDAVPDDAVQGSRAVALETARLIRIPHRVFTSALDSPAVEHTSDDRCPVPDRGSAPDRRDHSVDDLLVSPPLVADGSATAAEAARMITAAGGRGYLAVPTGAGRFGLVTDALLREKVVAADVRGDTRINEIMTREVPVAASGSRAVDALFTIVEHRLDHLLVVDDAGGLRGAVAPQDFLVAPCGAGMVLHEQIRQADDIDRLAALGRRLPGLVVDLVRQRRDAAETSAALSLVVDALHRRAAELVFREHPELARSEATLLVLGSNARREPSLGSDIDSAVVLADSVDTPERQNAYRTAFAELAEVLRTAGLRVDTHGANAASPVFARTRTEWQAAAELWLGSPLEDRGLLMAALLIDSRPLQGEQASSVVDDVFADVRSHPATMRLMIRESLSHQARLRSVSDVLAGRGGTFDLKAHALRPISAIARWGSSVGGLVGTVDAVPSGGRIRVGAVAPRRSQDSDRGLRRPAADTAEPAGRTARARRPGLGRGVVAQAPTTGPRRGRAVGARDRIGAEAAAQRPSVHLARRTVRCTCQPVARSARATRPGVQLTGGGYRVDDARRLMPRRPGRGVSVLDGRQRSRHGTTTKGPSWTGR